jgi:hypothetical protein
LHSSQVPKEYFKEEVIHPGADSNAAIPQIILHPTNDDNESIKILLGKLHMDNQILIERAKANNEIIMQLIALLRERCLL